MKINNWLIVGVVAASLVACDPYDDAGKRGDTVIAVTGVAVDPAAGAIPFEGTAAGAAWNVPGVDCTVPNFVQITYNGLLNGAAIQTSPDDCTPAAGWLTVTPAAPAGSAWYACYMPSSPSQNEGASVVVYLGPAGGSIGWVDAEPFPASITVDSAAGAALDIPSVSVACAP